MKTNNNPELHPERSRRDSRRGSRKTIKIDDLIKFVDVIKTTQIPVIRKPGKVSCKLASVDLSSGTVSFFPLNKGGQGDVSKGMIAKASAQVDKLDLQTTRFTPPVNQAVCADFYEYNPYHYRCIQLKAGCSAGLGYSILPIDPELKNYETDPEYLKIKAFTDNPNEEQESFVELLKNWSIEKQVYGHGYLELLSNKKNELVEIYNLRALYTFIRKYYGKLVLTQEVASKNVNYPFLKPGAELPPDKREVLAIKEYSLKSKYYGSPPWYSATSPITLNRTIDEFHIRSFKNNMMIEFAIITEGGELDSKGMQAVTEFLRKNFAGIDNVGKSLYLHSDTPDVKIRIEKLNREQRDMSFVNLHEANRDTIIIAHGIPGKVLGIGTPGQLGGGEGEVQFQIFNETIVRPEREMIQSKINFLLRERLGITKFYIELKELDIENFLQLAQSLSLLGTTLDDNEKRAILNYEPRDESPENLSLRLTKFINEGMELRKRILENPPYKGGQGDG